MTTSDGGATSDRSAPVYNNGDDFTIVHRSLVTEAYVREQVRKSGMAVKLSSYVENEKTGETNDNLVRVEFCQKAEQTRGRSREKRKDETRRRDRGGDGIRGRRPRPLGNRDGEPVKGRSRSRIRKKIVFDSSGEEGDEDDTDRETLRTGTEDDGEQELQPEEVDQTETGEDDGTPADNNDTTQGGANTTLNESQDKRRGYCTRSKGLPSSARRNSRASSTPSKSAGRTGIKDHWADPSEDEEEGARSRSSGKKDERRAVLAQRQRREREKQQKRNRDWTLRSVGELPVLGEEPAQQGAQGSDARGAEEARQHHPQANGPTDGGQPSAQPQETRAPGPQGPATTAEDRRETTRERGLLDIPLISGGGVAPVSGTSSEPVESSPATAICLLYTSPSPRDRQKSRMPSSA